MYYWETQSTGGTEGLLDISMHEEEKWVTYKVPAIRISSDVSITALPG